MDSRILLVVGVISLELVASTTGRADAPQISNFHVQAAPRVDPVFGDVSSLRVAVDQFLALETDMGKARDDFSTSVHSTLALAGSVGPRTTATARPASGKTAACPVGVAAQYERAAESALRYLGLGRRLSGRFAEIRRADELGDVVGLTPDYRSKVQKTRDLYQTLLRDLREMRVAFHDQLGAELRHVGCKPLVPGAAPVKNSAPDLSDPALWDLDEPLADKSPPATPYDPVDEVSRGRDPKIPPNAAQAGPAIWIEVDNSRCGQPSKLTIDGTAFGEVPAGKKVQVRTRVGPHTLCLLPSLDKQACGDAGTVRRTYLYEGLTLAVRCQH